MASASSSANISAPILGINKSYAKPTWGLIHRTQSFDYHHVFAPSLQAAVLHSFRPVHILKHKVSRRA